jgi:regulator of CtrA degradation
MSEKRSAEPGAVSFSERLANSPLFASLFRDGMALVDETATYLDGSGRLESKKLERGAGLVYATEITLAQAKKEKTKVSLAACEPGDAKALALLPAKLQELIARSAKLQTEVRRLDASMHAAAAAKIATDNPVSRQMGLLKAAFEANARRSGT